MRRFALALAVFVAAAVLAAPAAAQTPCAPAPAQTAPQFAGTTPKLGDVVKNPGGDGGEVTTAQAYQYMDAVDRASDKVITGSLPARTWQDRELRYAIVGRTERLTPAGLQGVRQAAQALRNPLTTEAEANQIIASNPAILWVASNVHGGEESGTDASLRVLYELADRTDASAQRILDNAVVVLLPIQNPDGREADTRRNFYGFDMNRDWFARTQPETDGKIELLRQYPGPLFIDAHEMGRKTYFFPPNADPIYHEITDEAVSWINNDYGCAMIDEFTEQGIPFFNRDLYDLFYMGYGDTVPATGFGAAGMTFEKASGDPIATRLYEQYLTQWTSLSVAAERKARILSEWASSWHEAYTQGVNGFLEPNEIVNPGNEVVTDVPTEPLRHYFLRADDPSKTREVQAIVRRLQRMDVQVYQLNRQLRVSDYKPYGRDRQAVTLPAGTYWIPMAQMQKHWVQAMLNEDTYTPFPYFYDVTAWSQPLLFNVQGGSSGLELSPAASPAPQLGDPGEPAIGRDALKVALFQTDDGTSAIESSGWLRYLLERRWNLPYQDVTAKDIGSGALDNFDVVLVPNGSATSGEKALGGRGIRALQDWVGAGGHWISWRGGTELAARIGVTTALLDSPTTDVPGSLFRVQMTSDPLDNGVGPFAYAFYEYDDVMTASNPASVAMQFPPAASEDFFISGFASDNTEAELGGTAAAIDEPFGAGRSTVFSVEPNFRAFTNGTQKVLRNAILGAGAGTAARASGRNLVSAARVRRSRAAAKQLVGSSATIRLSVERSSAARAARILRRYDARYRVQRTPGRTAFLIANPRQLAADEHPFATRLPSALEQAGVETIAFRVP